jgi:anti-sigma-K factor RskA
VTHEEARELLEIGAAEPGGLERLSAGDAEQSAALAGHLAGCDSCREEYARLHRAAGLLRSTIPQLLSPDLRARTLARIAAEGRPRGVTVGAGSALAAGGAAAAAAGRPMSIGAVPTPMRPEIPERAAGRRRSSRGPGTLAWLGSLAAAVVVAVGLSWLLVGRPMADAAREDRDSAAALARLTTATVALQARPDTQQITLAAAAGAAADASGVLSFSSSAREIVVVSTGLQAPPDGEEYRCWIDSNGRREQLGRMYQVGDISAWEGAADAVASVPAGARFGISLARAGGSGDGEPVLTGQYGGP